MANEDHLAILKQGVEVWNKWREENPDVQPNLSRTNLSDVRLIGANLIGANLGGTNLTRSDLTGANLAQVNLSGALFYWTNLTEANLDGALLLLAVFIETVLGDTNFEHAMLVETVFSNVDLSRAKGLKTCIHEGPCTIDHRTIERSGELPLAFLRGCGLPDTMIEYLSSLRNDPFRFYSCFISYSEKDHSFAERLHADLQDNGVRCWFAREDLKGGDRFRDRIDESIRIYDKLLLVLSKNSIASDWVESEVETAFEKERKQRGKKRTVLFPIRLDQAIMRTRVGWASHLRRSRHISDFSEWKDHDSYQKGFERLLRDLKDEVIAGGAADGE